MNRFIIAEPQNCIGCRTCEVACAMAHPQEIGGEALSPANFHPRLSVIRTAKISTPVLCRQCEDAPCARACPNGAIIHADDSIQVLQERCIGCKTCMVACPYGAMQVVSLPAKRNGPLTSRVATAQALKCDLCVDRADGPACIPSCPTKALVMVDRNALEEAMRKRRLQAALDNPATAL